MLVSVRYNANMKLNKKIVVSAIALTIIGGGTTAAMFSQPEPVKSQVTEEAQAPEQQQTNTEGTEATEQPTNPAAPTTGGTSSNQGSSQSSDPEPTPPPAPTPPPVTVVSQQSRWTVDTSKPQSFLWYCDQNLSNGTSKTLFLGGSTEFGNSSGVPKMKYNCQSL